MTSKKKTLLLTLLAIILTPLAVFVAVDLYHYFNNKSPYRTLFIPRLEAGSFEITTLDLDKTDMVGNMLIHSPLPFNLAADSMQYKIFIGGEEVIKSSYPKSLNIRRWDSTWIQLPVTIYSEKLLAVLQNAEKRGEDSIVYRIQTRFFTHLPFRQEFDLDIDKRLPLFYIPTAQLQKLTFDSLSLKGVTLYINLMIGNKNKIPFEFKDLKYKFAIADYPWISGAKWGEIKIKEQDSTQLVLPIRISFTDAFKSLGPLIRKGGKTDYRFGLDLKMVSESNALKNSRIVVKNDGTISEIVAVAKEEGAKKKEEKKEEKERKKDEKKRRKMRD
ncbi:MAG TPA: LEA type 2 family protein [Chitinophagales bacterium]|nr:LEA type 2 family protein [Chitinophagales bacterium]